MATVITNLLSAIPFFGHDLVESNIITIYDKTNINSMLSILPTIGSVSIHALKKGKTIKLDKQQYLNIPYSFIAFLVGLIDGDGYIQISRTSKGFITIKLAIQLHLDDLSTLQYIHSTLNIGNLKIWKDHKSPNCKLVISKTDLQEILFPLLIHHNVYFLTNTRRSQFDLAMFVLKENIKLYDNLPSDIKSINTYFPILNSKMDYVYLPFFKNWIVGFTVAEGSFFIKKNLEACFQLKQRTHINLFEAIKLIFNTNRKLIFENNKYCQFSVSSKSDIQTVINFFSFSGLHPLTGSKLIEYLTWIENINYNKLSNHKIVNTTFKSFISKYNWMFEYNNFLSINYLRVLGIFILKINIICLIFFSIFYLLTYYVNFNLFFETVSLSLLPIIYDNADKDKAIAIKNNRKLSGVYKWTHKKSGKFYIGSSVDLGRRFSCYYSYIYLSKHSKNSFIYKSLLKYGYSAFSLEILEYCNKDILIKREQFYIDTLKPEYNLLNKAGSRLGFKTSELTKLKISKSLVGFKASKNTKEKLKLAKLGVPRDDLTKKKLREHLLKLNTIKRNNIKVTILDLDTKLTFEYESIREAAKSIGSYANNLIKYEKLQLNKNYTKPFKNRYVIVIHRNKS